VVGLESVLGVILVGLFNKAVAWKANQKPEDGKDKR
jgi:hypothetical protein